MKKCLICDFHEGRDDLQSTLGATPICLECFHAKAEHPVDIHRATKRYDTGPYLRDLLRGVTCWGGQELGYLDLRTYERRVSAQMPAIIKVEPKLEPEDEDILAEITSKVISLKKDDDFNFYVWDDLVRPSWLQNIVNTIAIWLGLRVA